MATDSDESQEAEIKRALAKAEALIRKTAFEIDGSVLPEGTAHLGKTYAMYEVALRQKYSSNKKVS